MAYYILYPKDKKAKVKVIDHKPQRPWKGYGFAEGPLKTLKDVGHRLNAMSIVASRRPVKFRKYLSY